MRRCSVSQYSSSSLRCGCVSGGLGLGGPEGNEETYGVQALDVRDVGGDGELELIWQVGGATAGDAGARCQGHFEYGSFVEQNVRGNWGFGGGILMR
jgi:hypothetical protein